MLKYVYQDYDPSYQKLFILEKQRIEDSAFQDIVIEHVGSTAVIGLGGKGIIDILILVPKPQMELLRNHLENLGYIFNHNFSSQQRYFFKHTRSDLQNMAKTYHVHLTFSESGIGQDLMLFRDFLNANCECKLQYSQIKQQACHDAENDGKLYRSLKEPIIQTIKLKMLEWQNKKFTSKGEAVD